MLKRLLMGRVFPLKRAVYVMTALLMTLLLFSAPASAATHVRGSGATYANPVIAQTTPDPAIIRALDGYYYTIATSDAWQDGTFHLLPIYRSTDLVHWTFVGDAFASRPAWVQATAGLWAPDLQYYNHKYYMYYTASDTNPLPKYSTTGGSAIGVAVADTPAGPWSDAGDSAGGSYAHGPIVPPRPCVYNTDPSCYYATIDPAEFTDHDGQKYLYYGSYFGGTLVQKMTPDGLHVVGPAYQVGHWDRYEGTYVIRHDVNGQAYYYNFSSSADCCSGPNSGYSVIVNRAKSPLGPFVDENGFPMMRPTGQPVPTTRPSNDPAGNNYGAEGGGYPTLKQNGNKWHGIGHNAIITDISGQDWIIYHGMDASDGWVNGLPSGVHIMYRQLLMDRLDWTADGWPVVNDGAGPSLMHSAPVTTPIFGDNFNAPTSCAAPGNGNDLAANWSASGGSWSVNAGTCVTGGYAEQSATSGQSLLVSRTAVPAGYRVECDLRLEQAGEHGRYGCLASYQQRSASYIAALIDPAAKALVTVPYLNGRVAGTAQATPLPASYDAGEWYHLSIEEDMSRPGRPLFRFTLSDRNRDPLAQQERTLPGLYAYLGGAVGLFSENAHADFDNVNGARLSTHVAPPQGAPRLGMLLTAYSDEFNGSLGPQWSWIREDPTKHAIVNGQLKLIVNGDLYRNSNNATNLLLEAQPDGDYLLETKITFDPNNNYQQAGLLVYSDDDHYIKVGPFHGGTLTKILSGYENLLKLPSGDTACDVQPAPGSNIAVTTYTRDQCPNEGEAWDNLSNPKPTLNGSTAYPPTVTNWLRIYRHGTVYTPYSSLDGVHWVKGQAWSLGAMSADFPVRIGLFAFSGGSFNDVPAYFDYVRVYSEP